MKKLLLTTAVLLGLAFPAAAATIELGVGGPGTVTTVASGGGTASVSGASANGFDINISGTGVPILSGADLLNGNTIDAILAGGAASAVNVWVTSIGNLIPTGLQSLLSSFTQNELTAGWTVQAFTYADNGNTAYGTQQLLADTLFSSSDPPDVLQTATADLGAGPYSLTERWLITAPGAGDTNNTTDISVTPIPGAIGLMASGFAFFFGLLWKKRKPLASAFA